MGEFPPMAVVPSAELQNLILESVLVMPYQRPGGFALSQIILCFYHKSLLSSASLRTLSTQAVFWGW